MSKVMTFEGITYHLLSSGLLSPEQAKQFESKAEAQKARLTKNQEKGRGNTKNPISKIDLSPVEVLASFAFPIKNNTDQVLTEEVIMQALAEAAQLSYVKIDPLKIDPSMVSIIPRRFALKHALMPLHLKNEVLTIATADPFDTEVFDQLKRSTGFQIVPVVSTRPEIQKVITEMHGFRSSVNAAEKELVPQLDLGNLEQFVKLQSISELQVTDRHVINAVEYMLQYAYDQRASDIHIEAKREKSLIRFRIDGVLHSVNQLPKVVHSAVIARIKTLARMDIAEKRRPQDGRIKTKHKDREIELRISTLPVAFGEKAVIRIFDPEILMQPLKELGFFPMEYGLFESFLEKPHGLILLTGPTGSGKTTTLYSALKKLATDKVNITTIEDPIEMVYETFNQVAVHNQTGITFASTLRTILRQDPDIIMVGEIRDLETAENVIQAALTGHLVLSTLHTNDASSAVTRLTDLGVPPYLIGTTLIGVVAQRLVRKICPNCADETPITQEQARTLELPWNNESPISLRYGKGCNQCRSTGYKGRTGIHEVLNITDEIRLAVGNTNQHGSIRGLAKKEGMKTLRECAIQKMLHGGTSFDEVLMITGED